MLLLASGILDTLKAFGKWLLDFALGLGGPGLFLLAVVDSSFLSVPEGNDLLIVVKSTNATWAAMSYYVAMTVAGSTVGCSMLYSVGRFGGGPVAKRFNRRKVEEIGRLYSRRGALAIAIPAILPPPLPFKIFVFSAGVFKVPFHQFVAAIVAGRTVRYGMWGVLAVVYGDAVRRFLVENVKTVGIAMIVLMAVALLLYVLRRSLRRRREALVQASGKTLLALCLLVPLVSLQCAVKRTSVTEVPQAKLQARDASLTELVELVNDRYSSFQSLVFAKLEVEFTGAAVKDGFVEEDKYRRADGVMIASRPGSIYLNIKNPLGGASLATMASSQGRFQVWVPRERKYFVGSTDVVLEEETQDSRLSVRPHHLLPGLLVEPLRAEGGKRFLSVKEDEDSRFKYYVVSVTEINSDNRFARMIRELWFERSRLELVRQRYYGPTGAVETDISYESPADVEGRMIATVVDIRRPGERYSMKFEIDPTQVSIDRALQANTFEVPRPATAEVVVVGEQAEPR